MRSAIRDLEHVDTELRRLEQAASWPLNTRSSDAQGAVRLLRESLDLLDAIGWPRDETREEWEADMSTATAS